MIRKSCIPHGTDEVLVVFDEDGVTKNHLLRGVKDLSARYGAHEQQADSDRKLLEAEIKARRDVIDRDSFDQAEKEILDAAAKASATSEV